MEPMSSRNNPFQELEHFFERMSRQFEETSQMWEGDGPLSTWSSRRETLAVDLVDRGEEFVATVDLPGFEREDVDISVTDNTLRISADHEEHTDEQRGQVLRKERRHRSTERSIRLPEEVDMEGTTAHIKHGVLTVTLPKVDTAAPRSVDIEVE